jgi:hypothetical protein
MKFDPRTWRHRGQTETYVRLAVCGCASLQMIILASGLSVVFFVSCLIEWIKRSVWCESSIDLRVIRIRPFCLYWANGSFEKTRTIDHGQVILRGWDSRYSCFSINGENDSKSIFLGRTPWPRSPCPSGHRPRQDLQPKRHQLVGLGERRRQETQRVGCVVIRSIQTVWPFGHRTHGLLCRSFDESENTEEYTKTSRKVHPTQPRIIVHHHQSSMWLLKDGVEGCDVVKVYAYPLLVLLEL